ncbi:MAG: response regulator [bacterium]
MDDYERKFTVENRFETPPEERPRILVVDDDKYVVKSLEIILQKEGYEVTVANDGEQALKLLEHHTYDLILTDLKMEDIDGLDVLQQAKLLDPETVVIMLTGHSSIETAVDGMKHGAFDYLIKPCSNDIIRMTVKRGLDKRLYEIERKAIAEKIERRAVELAELNKIAAIVGSSLELRQILGDALSTVTKGLNVESGYVGLFGEKNSQRLQIHAVEGFLPWRAGKSFLLNNQCICGQAKTRRTIVQVLPENQATFKVLDHCLDEKFCSAVCIPLDSRGRILGLLCLASQRNLAFKEHDLNFLTAVANQIAIAIDNAQLYRKVRSMNQILEKKVKSRTAELALLFNASEKISSVSTIQELFKTFSTLLADFLKTDVVGLLTYTEELKYLGIEIRSGYHFVDESDWFVERIISLSPLEVARNQIEVDVKKLSTPHEPAKATQVKWQTLIPLKEGDQDLGAIYIASFKAKPLNKNQKRVLSTIANQLSLTIHRLSERIRKEKSRVESMLQSMIDGVILLDSDFRISVINPAGREMLKLINKSSSLKSLKKLGKMPIKQLLHGFPQNGKKSAPVEIITEDEPQKIFSLSSSLVRGLDGANMGYVIVLRDITEHHEAQEQLFLASKLASIGELASGVAHEINNPLTSIVGFAQLMLMDETSTEKRQNLQKIYDEGLRTKYIVKNLLGFARQQTGKRDFVNVNFLIKSVINLFGKQPELNNIELSGEFCKELPPLVGDPGHLQQVFLNMVQNAFDAIIQHKKGSFIRIKTRLVNDSIIRIEIEDDGPGIPGAVQKKVFNPFFTTKEVGRGTGLGLSICHKIINSHGGTITLRSQVNKGSVFTIDLPKYKG